MHSNSNSKATKSFKLAIKGVNDLATTNPELLNEWNYQKNDINPCDVSAGSNRIIYWKCKNGHSWSTPAYAKQGCPLCNKKLKTSVAEKIIAYYLKKENLDIIENYKLTDYNNKELDIYIPSLKIAIEYDGRQYHNNKLDKDNEKNDICKYLGIQLLRIREPNLPTTNNNSKNYNIGSLGKHNHEYMNDVIKWIFNVLKLDYSNIDVMENIQEIIEIQANNNTNEKFLREYPTLTKEWYNTKNKVSIRDVTKGSSLKVWWLCSKGHSYQSRVDSRVRGNGCPVCKAEKAKLQKRATTSVDDIATLRPDLVNEWHEDNELKSTELKIQSNKKVKWIDKYGHIWIDTVAHRSSGRGCPYCAGKKILSGFNDLATKKPFLLEYWDYDKNDIKPTELSPESHKKVYLKCEHGHSWLKDPHSIKNRVICPICKGGK